MPRGARLYRHYSTLKVTPRVAFIFKSRGMPRGGAAAPLSGVAGVMRKRTGSEAQVDGQRKRPVITMADISYNYHL